VTKLYASKFPTHHRGRRSIVRAESCVPWREGNVSACGGMASLTAWAANVRSARTLSLVCSYPLLTGDSVRQIYANGDLLHLDIGAGYNGYWGDLTRNLWYAET